MNVRSHAGRFVKLLILVLALFFLADAVVKGGSQVKSAATSDNWHLLMGTMVLASAAMFWIAMVWVRILKYLNANISYRVGISIYFVGEAAKYIPGALWAVLGRSELAVKHGVPRLDAYSSTLLSLAYNLVLSALLASLLTAPFALMAQQGSLKPLWLLVLLPAGMLALHPVFLTAVIRLLERIVHRKLDITVLPWGMSVVFVLSYLPAWLLVGATTWLSAEVIGMQTSPLIMVFAMCLAWVAGFIAIPAPGGLGVREAVFIALVGSAIATPSAAAIALITRVAFVLADALGALLGMVALKMTEVRAYHPDEG